MIYKSARKSCTRYVTDLIAGLPGSGLTYLEWTAVADITSIPANDVAGVSGFSFHDDGNSWSATLSLNISTHQDITGLRLIDLTDYFYEALRTDKSFNLLDPTSGQPIGTFGVLSGTLVSPVIAATKRPIQTITAPLRVQLVVT